MCSCAHQEGSPLSKQPIFAPQFVQHPRNLQTSASPRSKRRLAPCHPRANRILETAVMIDPSSFPSKTTVLNGKKYFYIDQPAIGKQKDTIVRRSISSRCLANIARFSSTVGQTAGMAGGTRFPSSQRPATASSASPRLALATARTAQRTCSPTR